MVHIVWLVHTVEVGTPSTYGTAGTCTYGTVRLAPNMPA